LAKAKGAAGTRIKAGQKLTKATMREYQVVANGARWDVERDDTFFGAFAYDIHTAIGLAISEAQRDKHNGVLATVCAEQPDGNCKHYWP
jgi:hypothetical protein